MFCCRFHALEDPFGAQSRLAVILATMLTNLALNAYFFTTFEHKPLADVWIALGAGLGTLPLLNRVQSHQQR
jgi:hypothetical protein